MSIFKNNKLTKNNRGSAVTEKILMTLVSVSLAFSGIAYMNKVMTNAVEKAGGGLFDTNGQTVLPQGPQTGGNNNNQSADAIDSEILGRWIMNSTIDFTDFSPEGHEFTFVSQLNITDYPLDDGTYANIDIFYDKIMYDSVTNEVTMRVSFYYAGTTNLWKRESHPISIAEFEAGMASINQDAGGFNITDISKVKDKQNLLNWLKKNAVKTDKKLTSTYETVKICDLNITSGPYKTCAINDKMYIFDFGFNGTCVYEFNPLTNQTTKIINNIPFEFLSGMNSYYTKEVCVVGGKAYFLERTLEGNPIVNNHVVIFDPVNKTFTNGALLPENYDTFSSTVVLNDKIYCFNGKRIVDKNVPVNNYQIETFTKVYEYNTTNDTFTEVCDINMDLNGSAGVAYENKIIFVGNKKQEPGTTFPDNILSFDPNSKAISKIGEFSYGNIGTHAFSNFEIVDGNIYLTLIDRDYNASYDDLITEILLYNPTLGTFLYQSPKVVLTKTLYNGLHTINGKMYSIQVDNNDPRKPIQNIVELKFS